MEKSEIEKSGTENKNNARAELLRVLKFGLIGVLNTGIDYGMFFVFFSLLHVDKSLAQVLATAVSMTNSYFMNRYWTFRQTGRAQAGEMGKFIIVNLVSMGVTILCLNLFYDALHLERIANLFFGALGLRLRLEGSGAVLFCKLVATPFSLAVNFLGNRLWVFRKNEKKEQRSA